MKNLALLLLFVLFIQITLTGQTNVKNNWIYLTTKDSADLSGTGYRPQDVQNIFPEGNTTCLVYKHAIVSVDNNRQTAIYNLDSLPEITASYWDSTHKYLAVAATQTLYLFDVTNNIINLKAKKHYSDDTLTCIDYNAKTGDYYVGNSSGELLTYCNPAKYLLDSLRIDTITFNKVISIANNGKDMLIIATPNRVYPYNIIKKELGYIKAYSPNPVLGVYHISGDDFSFYANENSFLAIQEWVNVKNEKKYSFVEGGSYNFIHGMAVSVDDMSFILDDRGSFRICLWNKYKGKYAYNLFNFTLFDTRTKSYMYSTKKHVKILRFYAYKNKMLFVDESNRLFTFDILYRNTALE